MTLRDRIADVLTRRALWGFGLLLVLLGAVASGLPGVRLAADSRAFFGTGNQEYDGVLQIDETYTLPTTVMIMVVPPDATTFDPATLQTLLELGEEAWQTPYTLRIDTALNAMHVYAEDDQIMVEPMLDELAPIDTAAATRFRDLALASDDLRNRLLSEAGDAYGIVIRVVLPDEGADAARQEVVAFTEALQARWQDRLPGWEVRVTGPLQANELLRKVALEDIFQIVPIAFGAVVVLLTVALGSFRPVAASLSVMVTSTIATFGFAGWLEYELTAGTTIGPLGVMVLVSASCVHITLAWMRAGEAGQSEPFRAALAVNLAPVTVSHLSTAFGFLCLNFSPSPPLAEMGNIVAFGLVFGLGGVFVILPLFLHNRRDTGAGRLKIRAETMRSLASWIVRRRQLVLAGFAVTVVMAGIGISRIQFDDNVIRYFDDRYVLRQDSDAISDRLTGLEALQFSFRAPEGGSVFQPEFLRNIDRFAGWLAEQPEVMAVSAITDILKSVNQSMGRDEPAEYRIADTQESNAQLMLFYELSLPVGVDMNAQMDVDRTQTLVSATVHTESSAALRTLAARAEVWLSAEEPALNSRAAGIAIAFARISERNNSQMILGFGVALVVVSGTLMLTLRSIGYGFISLVPNLMPAILAFGAWGLTLGDLNLGSTVVTTMTFGIVVDDTVHFLMHYLRQKRYGLEVGLALEETFAVVGSSILLSSLALMLGFAIMATSGFAINQHIGLLTATVILFALLADLLLLPALLATMKGKNP